MEYDKEVTTITDILQALDRFDNKEEIVEVIKPSLYDIETDYHTEELFRQELDKYKAKEKELRELCKKVTIDNYYLTKIVEAKDILDILDKQ